MRNNDADRVWANEKYSAFARKLTKLAADQDKCGKTTRLAVKWGKVQAEVDLAIDEALNVRNMVY